MGTFALEHGQAHHEGVQGEGGVDVQVSEEDLASIRFADLASGVPLCQGTPFHPR
jgi:hypothetical protein